MAKKRALTKAYHMEFVLTSLGSVSGIPHGDKELFKATGHASQDILPHSRQREPLFLLQRYDMLERVHAKRLQIPDSARRIVETLLPRRDIFPVPDTPGQEGSELSRSEVLGELLPEA